VGATVGKGVGELVGDLVAATVGVGVGDFVGNGVTATVVGADVGAAATILAVLPSLLVPVAPANLIIRIMFFSCGPTSIEMPVGYSVAPA